MAVKVLIQRKIKPGKETALGEVIKDIRPGWFRALFLEKPCDPSTTLLFTW